MQRVHNDLNGKMRERKKTNTAQWDKGQNIVKNHNLHHKGRRKLELIKILYIDLTGFEYFQSSKRITDYFFQN